MSNQKIRKTLNISLQSKKYTDSINKIVQNWENEGLNISTETCEALLKIDKIKNYNTFKKIFDIVSLLENVLEIYTEQDIDIDELLSEIVDIDKVRFSQILVELNEKKNEKVGEINRPTINIREEKKEQIVEKNNVKKDDSSFDILFNV